MSTYLTNIIAAASRLNEDATADILSDIERQRHLFAFSKVSVGDMLQLKVGQTITGHFLDADVSADKRLFLKLTNSQYANLVVAKIVAVARGITEGNLVIENAEELPHWFSEFYDRMLFGSHTDKLPPVDLDLKDGPLDNYEGSFFISIQAYLKPADGEIPNKLVLLTDCGRWFKKDPPDENLYPKFFDTFGLEGDQESDKILSGYNLIDGSWITQIFEELDSFLSDPTQNKLTVEENKARHEALRARLRKLLD